MTALSVNLATLPADVSRSIQTVLDQHLVDLVVSRTGEALDQEARAKLLAELGRNVAGVLALFEVEP